MWRKTWFCVTASCMDFQKSWKWSIGGSANWKASDSPPKHCLIWGRFLPSVHITSPQWKAFCGVMVHALPLMVRWQEILFQMFESRKVSLLNQVTPIFGGWDLSFYFYNGPPTVVLIWTTDLNRLQLWTDYIFSNVSRWRWNQAQDFKKQSFCFIFYNRCFANSTQKRPPGREIELTTLFAWGDSPHQSTPMSPRQKTWNNN